MANAQQRRAFCQVLELPTKLISIVEKEMIYFITLKRARTMRRREEKEKENKK
jgi:hypothetical protein